MAVKLIQMTRTVVNIAAYTLGSKRTRSAPGIDLIVRITCMAIACILLSPLATSAMIASQRAENVLIGDALSRPVVDRRTQSSGFTEPRLADVLCALVRERKGMQSECDVLPFDSEQAWWTSLQRRRPVRSQNI